MENQKTVSQPYFRQDVPKNNNNHHNHKRQQTEISMKINLLPFCFRRNLFIFSCFIVNSMTETPCVFSYTNRGPFGSRKTNNMSWLLLSIVIVIDNFAYPILGGKH
ncbi:hypothetical protein DERF_001557 [Dermatophagoides farinae]|uniref:Transmembrane protein n=1 Tax=Dermatophagoides farinae TaxID=6954 RepID=A0A922IB29_DERFA|nr:hypothetical protein DERF_001557 [Dermatophagoides farinae]